MSTYSTLFTWVLKGNKINLHKKFSRIFLNSSSSDCLWIQKPVMHAVKNSLLEILDFKDSYRIHPKLCWISAFYIWMDSTSCPRANDSNFNLIEIVKLELCPNYVNVLIVCRINFEISLSFFFSYFLQSNLYKKLPKPLLIS